MSDAVIVGLSGGLGNQLFQYASAKALSLRLNLPLKLDLTWFSCNPSRAYELDKYSLTEELFFDKLFWSLRLGCVKNKIFRKFGEFYLGKPVFREKNFDFNQEFLSLSQSVYMEGYWQSHLYFSGYKDSILKSVIFKGAMPSSVLEILSVINAKKNSVCVHVRRGDYINDVKNLQIYASCPVNYYVNAINLLNQDLEDIHCFIFSDEIDWARHNIKLNAGCTFVDVNSPSDPGLDLELMRNCKHFVIANSSFSWWAAWLGSYENKKVIAPKNWFLDQLKVTNDLIPSTWTVI